MANQQPQDTEQVSEPHAGLKDGWYWRNRDRALANQRAWIQRTSIRKSCEFCGLSFAARYRSTQRFCSPACNGASCRLPDSVDRLRRRRSEAGRRRRAAGWKSGQKGRWRGICERDGWVCWICRLPIDAALSPPDRLAGTADHVLPLSKGGSDTDGNLRAAHFSCNCRRGAGKFQPKEVA